MQTLGHFINGKKVEGSSGKFGDIFNPATGTIIKKVSFASQQDVNDAVQAATTAFTGWSETTPIKRARILFRFRELLEKNVDKIAAMITEQHGKVFSDAKGEVIRGLEVVEYVTGIPSLLTGLASKNVGTGVDCYGHRYPLGVCAGISPFNFPAMVPMWMFPVAIACGNTFIMKPSEKNPEICLFLAELLIDAGLPPGVFNVLNGDKDAVNALLTDQNISAISFVGSTPVAEHVYSTATASGKRVQALGGAKNHMVVMPDADINEAADALMGAAYGSAGERCMAISIAVTVGEETGDRLVENLKPRIKSLNIGPGTDSKMDMGPLISKEHYEKVKGYVDIGLEEGAELVVDGRELTVKDHENGYFLGGSLFDQLTPEMKIYKEEIFGPVLGVIRVADLDSALSLINDHEFGNGSAIFTQNGKAADYFSSKVLAGMVGVNVPIPVPVAYHSFGGWKRSLFGDHHVHGPEGLRFYTRLKTVTSRWPKGELSEAQFAMPTLG